LIRAALRDDRRTRTPTRKKRKAVSHAIAEAKVVLGFDALPSATDWSTGRARMTCPQSLVYAAAVGSILAQPVVHFWRESFSTEFSIFQQRSYTMAKKAKKKKAKKKK
jgi:hypothetical protein